MDYLSSTKTLFVGTNTKQILTLDISELFEEGAAEYLYAQAQQELELAQLRQGAAAAKRIEQTPVTDEELDAILKGKQ